MPMPCSFPCDDGVGRIQLVGYPFPDGHPAYPAARPLGKALMLTAQLLGSADLASAERALRRVVGDYELGRALPGAHLDHSFHRHEVSIILVPVASRWLP